MTRTQLKRESANRLMELRLRRWVQLAALLKLPLLRAPGSRLTRLMCAYNSFFDIPTVNRKLLCSALKVASTLPASSPPAAGPSELGNSLIVKPYVSEQEKGFLVVKFEKQLAKLTREEVLKRVEARYHLIFMPSSTGICTKPVIELAVRTRLPFYLMPVHACERTECTRFGPNCISLPFNAASWSSGELFHGRAERRDIDCLMVAIFAPWKRHWLLFKALRDLPAHLTAHCVGIPYEGRSKADLEAEADEYGVRDRITIIERPSQEDLRQYYRRAKVFCALTYQEGSFVVVAESLLAGTPVIMFRNAIVGTKPLISELTGTFVQSAAELARAIEHYQHVPPERYADIQNWAQKTISAERNCAQLSSILMKQATEAGKPWTVDIAPFHCVRQELVYSDPRSTSLFEDDRRYLSSIGISIS